MARHIRETTRRLSPGSVIRASTNQISTALAEEAVILHLESGVYYELDKVGTRIWEIVRNTATVADIEATLLREYDVQADRCGRDLGAFLDALAVEGLIDVTG